MLFSERHVILVLLLVSYVQIVASQEYGDPTAQELALDDWASGVRVAYCSDAAVEKLAEPFKASIAVFLNKFCRNATACFLVKPVNFAPEQVVLLDGYPRRDYGAAQFRFVVVLPHGAVPREKIRQPLLSKQILSNFLRKHIDDIAQRLGWKVLSFERFPKFDAITEFMNTALIPIGCFLLVFMFFLAYWSSTFSSSTSTGDAWMVSGASGGKNAAFRRTMEIIEEQKKYEQDVEAEDHSDKKEGVDGPMSESMISTAKEVSSSRRRSSEVLLDVSRLPIGPLSPARAHESGLPVIPEIVVVCSEGKTVQPGNRDSRERPSFSSSRRFSRRLSSFEEVMKEKRHRRLRANVFGGRDTKRMWKSGSMALGGFGKN